MKQLTPEKAKSRSSNTAEGRALATNVIAAMMKKQQTTVAPNMKARKISRKLSARKVIQQMLMDQQFGALGIENPIEKPRLY